MPNIKHSPGLGDSAEQRVIAKCPFLLTIESHCEPSVKRPVENAELSKIECDAGQTQSTKQAVAALTGGDLAQLIHAPIVHA